MAWTQELIFATPHPIYLDTKGDKHNLLTSIKIKLYASIWM